jgi:acyl-CoA thioester hydrolase
VAFAEVDLMGIFHHSNTVRLLEEARVDWLRSQGVLKEHAPVGSVAFAVGSLAVRYLRPLRFDEVVMVELQARLEGLRLWVEYRVIGPGRVVCAVARTELIPVGPNLRPCRLPTALKAAIDSGSWEEKWIEI